MSPGAAPRRGRRRTGEPPALAIVKKMFSDFARGDVLAVLDKIRDDATWVYPEGTVLGGTHKGKKGILGFFAKLGAVYPKGMTFSDVEVRGAGEKVFAEFRFAARTAGGPIVKESAIAVFTFAGGRVAAVREFNMGRERTVLGR